MRYFLFYPVAMLDCINIKANRLQI